MLFSRAPVSLTSAWPQKSDESVKPQPSQPTSQMDSILRFFTDDVSSILMKFNLAGKVNFVNM